jgi:hypothetical protein
VVHDAVPARRNGNCAGDGCWRGFDLTARRDGRLIELGKSRAFVPLCGD